MLLCKFYIGNSIIILFLSNFEVQKLSIDEKNMSLAALQRDGLVKERHCGASAEIHYMSGTSYFKLGLYPWAALLAC